MRVLNTLFLTASCLGLSAVNATGWSFTDGTVSIRAKGAGIDGGIKDKLALILRGVVASSTNHSLDYHRHQN